VCFPLPFSIQRSRITRYPWQSSNSSGGVDRTPTVASTRRGWLRQPRFRPLHPFTDNYLYLIYIPSSHMVYICSPYLNLKSQSITFILHLQFLLLPFHSTKSIILSQIKVTKVEFSFLHLSFFFSFLFELFFVIKVVIILFSRFELKNLGKSREVGIWELEMSTMSMRQYSDSDGMENSEPHSWWGCKHIRCYV
jgi:hypothetical protein